MNNYIKIFYISFLLIGGNSEAQINLNNASFEGIPADASMPAGWFSASDGTTPDILPGYWGVYEEPNDGETYVGLITRQDGSFESISQRLVSPLQKQSCYNFAIRLAHSKTYSGYNKELYLRIWITDTKNKRQQLIYQSEKVDNEEWQTINIDFVPKKDMHYIILEAYISDNRVSHKGNILIDNISPILICDKV